jgi:hypothetical protein
MPYMLYRIFNIARIFSIVLILVNHNANARLATIDDAQEQCLFYKVNVKIEKNGDAESIVEKKVKILKEPARLLYASYSMNYSQSLEKIEILEAKTIFQGKEYIVEKNQIEDKPLASPQGGFDESRQILISFPNIQLGADIYIKYKISSKSILQDHFAKAFFISQVVEKYDVSITSKIPLYLSLNDPNNIFAISKDKEEGFFNFNAKLKAPLLFYPVNEPQNSFAASDQYPWIVVSSMNSWKTYSDGFFPRYNEVINQPLPETLKDIYEEVKGIKDEVLQINMVTSRINEKIHYMGDWRSVDGRFLPRDLAITTSLKAADCKEFSTMTASILTKLGFKVNIALVTRGEYDYLFQSNIPLSFSSFNHAILLVVGHQGKTYWVDATNPISMTEGIFYDIAGKKALILDSNRPIIEIIPEISSTHSRVTNENYLSIDGEKILYEGLITLKGEVASPLYFAKLYLSEKTIQENIIKMLGGEYLEKSDIVTLSELNSRIVSDVIIKYSYGRDNRIIQTNRGRAIRITYDWLFSYANGSPDNILDLLVNDPHSYKRSTVIKGIKIKDIDQLNYNKQTDWIDLKRSCYYKGEDTVILDEIVYKKKIIRAEDFNKLDYKDLKNDLKKYYQDFLIILD